MHISGRRKNSIAKFARALNRKSEIFVYHAPEDIEQAFQSVGLSAKAKLGDTILPKIIGKVSEFNADGDWLVRKDLPKESRVVGQRIWRWKEFRGRYGSEDRERTINVERMCFPREFIPPPSLEMSVAIVKDKPRLVTPLATGTSDNLIKHAVNLYLEAFGECHLTDRPDDVPIVTPTRVNWRILPQGDTPWDTAEKAVTTRLPESEDQQQIIVERQRFICSFEPDSVFAGEGGFSDYLAYVFETKGLTVLESVTSGNAIYIFDKDWRKMSQLTKRDILAGNLERDRIIHATGWHERLDKSLR